MGENKTNTQMDRHQRNDNTPLSLAELAQHRERLQSMKLAELICAYEAGLHMCRLSRGKPPAATFIQRLVQAWRELRVRMPKR